MVLMITTMEPFRDLPDANEQLMNWVMQDAGNRIHGTTRTPPLKRFAETEQAMLKPLPNSVSVTWSPPWRL